MPKYTISDTLNVVEGLSRTSLYRMIENGDIAVEGQKRKRRIDASELIRVFGDKFNPDGIKQTSHNVPMEQNGTIEEDFIKRENKLLKEQIDALRKDFDRERTESREREQDHKKREEKLLGIINNQTLLLTDQSKKKKKGILGWFSRS